MFIIRTILFILIGVNCQTESEAVDDPEKDARKEKYGSCLIWFDGCNNCRVSTADFTLNCGNMVCTEKKDEFCLYGGASTQQDDCYMTLNKR